MCQLALNSNIQRVINLSNQFTDGEIELLINIFQTQVRKKSTKTDLRELLLTAPIWSDEDYENYKSAREHINNINFNENLYNNQHNYSSK